MSAQKVYEKMAEPAGNMVKAAIQQSLKKALESLMETWMETDGENAKQQIVLKACVLQMSDTRFQFEVESVNVTKKVSFTDEDFECYEIDLAQPDLPGMNQ
jgi:hypothetical protein